jgi:peroxiredoxin
VLTAGPGAVKAGDAAGTAPPACYPSRVIDAPARLPDATLATLQGEPVVLRDPSATARLVIVYRHACPFSNDVLPVIERVTRAFHGKRLLTLGLSLGSEDDTLDAINEHGLCFPQAVDTDARVSTALGLVLTPTVLLTSNDGTIVARCDGRDRTALLALLAHAARLSEADEAEVRRAAESFALPAERAGTPLDVA